MKSLRMTRTNDVRPKINVNNSHVYGECIAVSWLTWKRSKSQISDYTNTAQQ